MVHKGISKHEKFFVQEKGGEITVIGKPAAFFGYKLGDGKFENNDGIWAEWSWDDNCLELKNDRYGFYPIFYYRGKTSFGVSPNIFDLIEECSPIELDDAAISVFLRLGFYIDNDTPFSGIRALPAGARLFWKKNEFCVDSNNIQIQSMKTELSRDAAVKEYGELFQSVIKKFLVDDIEKVALPLSGGRDSRHILFALVRSNQRPNCCVTVNHFRPKSDEDAIIASKVAQFLNIRHEVLTQSNKPLNAELRKNILTNLCASEHSWILPLRDFLINNSFTVVYDGIGGDVLSAGLFLNDKRLNLYKACKLGALAEDILGPEGYLPKMILPSFYKRWSRELAISHLIPELGKYCNKPNPVGQFYFWNRTRRQIALSSWCILNDPCNVFAPYLSEEVYDFLAALPASYFLDHNFHTDAINAYYPEYAHLPFEVKTVPATTCNRINIAKFSFDTIRYCLSHKSSADYVKYLSFLLPRFIKGIANVEFGTSLHSLSVIPIYLIQLANVIANARNLA